MKKGISPLIAAVVLIAFVIAIASLTSGTFTGLTSEWGEDVQDKGQTTLSCTQTNLEINTVRWNGQNLSLSVHNVGSNKLTGLTAEVTSEDESITSKYYDEELSNGATGEYTVENITEPFKKIRFFGNACPNHDTIKEYNVTEETTSGTISSTSTETLDNDGDVYVSPELTIE